MLPARFFDTLRYDQKLATAIAEFIGVTRALLGRDVPIRYSNARGTHGVLTEHARENLSALEIGISC